MYQKFVKCMFLFLLYYHPFIDLKPFSEYCLEGYKMREMALRFKNLKQKLAQASNYLNIKILMLSPQLFTCFLSAAPEVTKK